VRSLAANSAPQCGTGARFRSTVAIIVLVTERTSPVALPSVSRAANHAVR